MADDSGLQDLERVLPADQFDVLESAMVPDVSPLRASLFGPVTYAYFDAGRERFGWLRDPSGLIAPAENVLTLGAPLLPADVHWFILLRRRRKGWRVDKALTWDSLRSARIAAGAEWIERHGYLIDFRSDGLKVGPFLGDFRDPARYLELLRRRYRPRRSGK